MCIWLLYMNMYIYLWYLAQFFLEREMFQTKAVDKIKTHRTFTESRAVYEIVWKNMLHTDRPKMTKRHMPFACWITKATDTQSEYLIRLLIALPRQQWIREGAPMLPYTHIACLVQCKKPSARCKFTRGLHVKYALFLSHFTKLDFSRQIFEKSSNLKIYEYPSSASRVVPRGQTDGRTGRRMDRETRRS
jgi:hypothetical protein